MDLFRCLSDEELDQRIRRMVDALSSGASEIETVASGKVRYVSRNDAMKTLASMERSRAKRLGLPPDPSDQMRAWHPVIRSGY